jgi:hypothetical protein
MFILFEIWLCSGFELSFVIDYVEYRHSVHSVLPTFPFHGCSYVTGLLHGPVGM